MDTSNKFGYLAALLKFFILSLKKHMRQFAFNARFHMRHFAEHMGHFADSKQNDKMSNIID